jgi:hypothetical protein
MGTRIFVVLCGAIAGVALSASAGERQGPPAKEFMGMPLQFAEDFESGNFERWAPSDPKAWRVTQQGENRVLDQFQPSNVETPVRSPFNRAVVKDIIVGDFVLDARVQSTTKDYPHRDVCLFFGYQDPAHMYYVHLGKQADAHANSIFLVNGEPRVSIAETRTSGTDWDDDWHQVRVVRKVGEGTIAVFFDDMNEPVMTAVDKHFTWGRVGVGTFDDTGNFDDVRLWGIVAEPSK